MSTQLDGMQLNRNISRLYNNTVNLLDFRDIEFLHILAIPVIS